eukprot:TRINITY_DN7727_c0_g1_i2.p1 TRINITY_DN7727_c0_g1~~TRINITY_DN7727_c0_g1_i2.p1  ORF type:complete len:406 (+),score=106.67 TRINITY_DN7727_c0_g1_i2:129-1346(+)
MLELATEEYHQAQCYDYTTPPAGFETIPDDVEFNPKLHLQLEMPEEIRDLKSFGYTDAEIAEFNLASDVGVTSPFRVLSDEGIRALRHVLKQLEPFAVVSPRIPCVLRGGMLRSKFVHDLCMSVDITNHICKIAKCQVIAHPMASQQGHMNFKPKVQPDKPVDRWHTDTTPLVTVMFVTDPDRYEGGNFEYFDGTKSEAQSYFKAGKPLPEDKVRRLPHQTPGYAVFQQGPAVFHRASRVTKGDERITFVQSYISIVPSHFAGCERLAETYNSVDPLPLYVPDWIRFRSWQAAQQLGYALKPSLLATLPAAFGNQSRDSNEVVDAVGKVTNSMLGLHKAVGCPFTGEKSEWIQVLDQATSPLKEMLGHMDDGSIAYKHARKAMDMMQFLCDDVAQFEGVAEMEYY